MAKTRDLGTPKVTCRFADNTPEQQAAWEKEVNFVLALIWQDYLRNGGDPDVFKNMQNIPPEEQAAYLESKKVSNMRKQAEAKKIG